MIHTTARERRLWILTGAVVAAIYSTLGLGRTLADELRDRDLLDAAFGLGVLVIGVSVVAISLGRVPRRRELGVALGIAAVYGMVLVRMAIPEERTHLIEYSIVAILIYEALRERAVAGRPIRAPALLAVVAATLIGAVDEGIQLLLPDRVFDPMDLAFNGLAAVMAVAGGSLLRLFRSDRPDA